YVVPNFHNPAGVTLCLERRGQLVDLARRYDLLIIEDNPYGLLRFDGELLPPLKALAPDRVVYLGTISKILSAGMRVGWVAAPPPILEKLLLAKQSADLCTSSMTQRLAQAYFATQDWRRVVDELSAIYRGRRDAMLSAMEEFFPEGAGWTRPQGGFFIWSKLPHYINTSDMLAAAIERKVAYVPGAGFFPDRSGTNYMRLNFSYPPEEKIWDGIKRLSAVIKREMQLAKSLGLVESEEGDPSAPGGKRG
ncbi:MAG: aminotransferase-like domain-containing protein, partial [Candidatus Geothermincolia bacterium]